jgi:hypothetical protein
MSMRVMVAIITGNILQFGVVPEIEEQILSFAQKFNQTTNVEFSTNPPFCQTAVNHSLYYFI